MKELETEFIGTGEVSGMKFRQIAISPKAYIYEVTNNDSQHYEVFKRTENTRFQTVSYPSAKSFGLWAWIKSELTDATKLFDRLSQ
jgi:phage tail sheath protein FI